MSRLLPVATRWRPSARSVWRDVLPKRRPISAASLSRDDGERRILRDVARDLVYRLADDHGRYDGHRGIRGDVRSGQSIRNGRWLMIRNW